MAKRLKGTYTRNAQSWYYDSSAYVSLSFSQHAQPSAWMAFSLFNNSTDGALLWVMDFGFFTSFSSNLIFYLHGGSYGTFQSSGQSLHNSAPQIGGQMYFSSDAAQFSGTPLVIVPIFNTSQVVPRPPIAILDPGWSLVCEGDAKDTDDGLFLRYVSIPGA